MLRLKFIQDLFSLGDRRLSSSVWFFILRIAQTLNRVGRHADARRVLDLMYARAPKPFTRGRRPTDDMFTGDPSLRHRATPTERKLGRYGEGAAVRGR